MNTKTPFIVHSFKWGHSIVVGVFLVGGPNDPREEGSSFPLSLCWPSGNESTFLIVTERRVCEHSADGELS